MEPGDAGMSKQKTQNNQTCNGCTVMIVQPSVRDQDVENAVLTILMEAYEERLATSFGICFKE